MPKDDERKIPGIEVPLQGKEKPSAPSAPTAPSAPSAPEILEVEVLTTAEAARVLAEPKFSETAETGLVISKKKIDAALIVLRTAWKIAPQKAIALALRILEVLSGKNLQGKDDIAAIDGGIKQGRYPTPYPSEVAFYGYKVEHNPGRMVYNPLGFALKAEDGFYAARDGRGFEPFSRDKNTKRLRRKWRPEETNELMRHIENLGLGKHFFIDKHGNICEKNGDIRSGVMLCDLLIHHNNEGERYAHVRRFSSQVDQALAMTAKKVAELHAKNPKGIGEILINDFVLQVEGEKITGVRLSLPDVRFEDKVDPLEQKATELTDLLWSAAAAGYAQGGTGIAQKHLKTILDNYDNHNVIEWLSKIIDERPTYGYISNRERLGFSRITNPEKVFEEIRTMVKDMIRKGKPKMLTAS